MAGFRHMNLDLGDWNLNTLFGCFTISQRFAFDKSTKDFKTFKIKEFKMISKIN